MDILSLICLGLASLGVAQALLMLVHAYEHRRFHRGRLKAADKDAFLASSDPPRVTLFVPCKGVDLELDEHLRALFRQEYGPYELCFIVESATDPALTVIERVCREFVRQPSRVIVAGLAQGCGQKVHNLMRATSVVPHDTEVLAFVDSDAHPNPQWLRRLVARLQARNVGVSTGYRWYAPVAPTLPNLMLSAINALVTNIMGPHKHNLVWGGSWAIRKSTFRELGFPQAWQGAITEDLPISSRVWNSGLRVGYEPHCLVTSPADTTWRGMAEFVRRQFLIVRVCLPRCWHAAFWTGVFTNLALWSAVALTATWLVSGADWRIPALLTTAIYGLTALRMSISSAAVRPFLNTQTSVIRRTERLMTWGWPLIATGNCLLIASAGVGQIIVWRGIRYRLESATRTVIENRPAPAPNCMVEPSARAV